MKAESDRPALDGFQTWDALDEISAELHKAGWSYGYVGLTGAHDGLWQADASEEGVRQIARAPTLMRCFQVLTLECLVPEEIDLSKP